MIRHRFQVSITVEDDDQTDPEEFIVGHLADILRKKFQKDIEEFGVIWPSNLEVKFIQTHYTYTPKKEETDAMEDTTPPTTIPRG